MFSFMTQMKTITDMNLKDRVTTPRCYKDETVMFFFSQVKLTVFHLSSKLMNVDSTSVALEPGG